MEFFFFFGEWLGYLLIIALEFDLNGGKHALYREFA